MAKRLSLFTAAVTMILAISLVVLPQEKVHAEIADGTYKVGYEMKEAGNENASIADGYFNKPATLTVKGGVKQIQLTVTSSSMVKSLSTPSGPVEVVSEDKGNETRTVRFRVDGDLSQPVNMDMHIVVPDLYDMNHTARAVFDVSGLDQASTAADKKETSKKDSQDKKDEKAKKEKKVIKAEKDKKAESDEEDKKDEKKAESAVKDESAEKAEENEKEDKTAEVESNEEDIEKDATSEKVKNTSVEKVPDKQVKNEQESDSTSSTLWVVLTVIVVLIVGFVVWKIRSKKSK